MPQLGPRFQQPCEVSDGNNTAGSKKRKREVEDSGSRQPTIEQAFHSSQQESHSSAASGISHISSPTSTGPPAHTAVMFNSSGTKVNPIAIDDVPSKRARIPPLVQDFVPVNREERIPSRKIVIRNLRPSRSDPQKYYDDGVAKLDRALKSLLKNETQLPSPLEELYRTVERLCMLGRAGDLYKRLSSRMRDYAENAVRVRLLETMETDDSDVTILKAVLAEWESWKSHWKQITLIYYFMDRDYLIDSPRPTLKKLSVQLFANNILRQDLIKSKTLRGFETMVLVARAGQDLDVKACKAAVSLFYDLDVYQESFEPHFLGSSEEFMSKLADQYMWEKSLRDYVITSLALINAEAERCDLLGITKSTKSKLMKILETYVVEVQKDRLVSVRDVGELLSANDVTILQMLYSLLARCGLGDKLSAAFCAWTEETGTNIIFDEAHENDMVVRLLTLKKQCDHVIDVAFHSNDSLKNASRQAFETFMNKSRKSSSTWNTDNSKPGEMIAKFVDHLLKGGSKAIPSELSKPALEAPTADDDMDNEVHDEESEVSEQLAQVLDIFRFLHGKAVFEAFYKKDLAKRLLMGRSASSDAEFGMLTRLKRECGAAFTQNLERMFSDIELSRQEMHLFRDRIESEKKSCIDFYVNVLSASAWPSYEDFTINLPPQVAEATTLFEKHYAHHANRKLQWKHGLAFVQIKARYPKGRRELIVSGFQAIVMLVFNNVELDEHVSYERIKAETGLPDKELVRTLQSLSCAKLRPIRKHPHSRDVGPTDTFTINSNFHPEKLRVKINQVQLKETKEENKATHERVHLDRQLETQAAIARIMKAQKQMTHPLLVAAVIDATKNRGELDVADINTNIDRLVDKEYLEAEGQNPVTYVYLA